MSSVQANDPGPSTHEPDDYGLPAEPSWRAVDWPAHERRTTVDDASVAYVDLGSGDGPPVVLVHGLGGRWRNWLENLPALARKRRVIALDLPGFGDSEMPAEAISVSGYARVVDRLCERLGLGPVAVIGNSMGGFVAAELALGSPSASSGSCSSTRPGSCRPPAIAIAPWPPSR